MRSEAVCFGPRCPSKTFFFIGAPAPETAAVSLSFVRELLRTLKESGTKRALVRVRATVFQPDLP